MDHFGIGNAMQGMLHTYISTSRQTGRTTSLVESLKDGDRVVCTNSKEAERLQRLCRERELKVDCIVVDPASPHRLMERRPSEGRTVFEHTWVEAYYLAAVQRCQAAIDELQRQSSGFGTAQIETRRQAMELSRWRV